MEHGIAAQSILLGATERGLGGCIITSIQRQSLREALDINPRYDILLVLALGKPQETIVVEPVGPDGDIKYWRDAEGPDLFGSPLLASAGLDRLTYRAHMIVITGSSFRAHGTQKPEKEMPIESTP